MSTVLFLDISQAAMLSHEQIKVASGILVFYPKHLKGWEEPWAHTYNKNKQVPCPAMNYYTTKCKSDNTTNEDKWGKLLKQHVHG